MVVYAIFQSSGCAGAHPQLCVDPPLNKSYQVG